MRPQRKPSKGVLATREKSGPMRCRAYLEWLRGCRCWACGADGRMQAAHYSGPEVPGEDRGGMGVKNADRWAVPLCPDCHRLQHDIGHVAFDRHAGAQMHKGCASHWQHWQMNTQAGRRWREDHG